MLPLFLTTILGLVACTDEAAEALLTCDGGNMEACYNDGMAAIRPPRPQFGDARQSFSKACMTHHAESCYQLAKLVRNAKGGPKDLVRAVDLYGIACEEWKVPDACVDLGLALYDGEGTREDPERSVQLLKKACNLEEPIWRACARLADAYAEGKGVDKKDEDKAEELYAKSCDAKFAKACVAAGRRHLESRRKDDIIAAAKYFGKACEIDARKGCFELAKMHEDGKWDDATDKAASEFYQKTCNIDPPRGCYEAAELMAAGKVEAREGEIEYLYNLACEHGHTEACSKRQIDLGNNR